LPLGQTSEKAPTAIDLASPKSNLMRQPAGRNTWNTRNTSKTGTPKGASS
jgi:hypothetical protein